MLQNIIVLVIVFSAIGYALLALYRNVRVKKSDNCNCNCGCGSARQTEGYKLE